MLNLCIDVASKESSLWSQIDKLCIGYACVEMSDVDKTLDGMVSDGLIH